MTPEEVLRAGAFGGGYFRPINSGVVRARLQGAWRELPASWLAGLSIPTAVASPTYRESANRYGVRCGQSLEAWEESGWITAWDPYGWFQWYCRWTLGRRCEDDGRQIARWLACAGA